MLMVHNDSEVCSASSPDSNGISHCSIVIDLQIREISVRVVDASQFRDRDEIISVQENNLKHLLLL